MMLAFPGDSQTIMTDSSIELRSRERKTPPCFQDGVVAISVFLLRMNFPHAAAEAGHAHETCIRCDVDIVHLNERQAGAKAAPTHSTVNSAINAEERSGVHGVLVHGADRQPRNGNIGQPSADVGKREAATFLGVYRTIN